MRIRSLPVVAAATLLASAGIAASAVASPAGTARPNSWRFRSFSAPPRTNTPFKSSDFAGYELEGYGSSLSTTTTFVVPKVTGCSTTGSGIVPGTSIGEPGGYSGAGVFVGCVGGKAVYVPLLVINTKIHEYKSLAVKPGDKIVVTAAENFKATKLTFTDKTRKGVAKTLTGAGDASYGGVVGYPEFGDAAVPPFSSSHEPVPNFGQIGFTRSQITIPLGFTGPGGDFQYDLYNTSTNTLEVSTGNLSSNGESFTTTFVNP